jgi:regulator of sigma E protease
MGVSLSLVETIRQPFTTAVVEGFWRTVDTTIKITIGLGTLLAGAVSGTADFSQVAGPVGIVGYVGDAAAVGFTSVLLFTAIISLNLAVINLLPVPALDGGRLVFVAIETVIRRPIPPMWAARVNFIGIVLLLLLMLVATINDIGRLW